MEFLGDLCEEPFGEGCARVEIDTPDLRGDDPGLREAVIAER